VIVVIEAVAIVSRLKHVYLIDNNLEYSTLIKAGNRIIYLFIIHSLFCQFHIIIILVLVPSVHANLTFSWKITVLIVIAAETSNLPFNQLACFQTLGMFTQ
jgi:hypothetical protein